MSAVGLEKKSPFAVSEASASSFNQQGRFEQSQAPARFVQPMPQPVAAAQQPPPPAAPRPSPASSSSSAPVVTIGVDKTFRWKAGTDEGAVLEDAPLLAGLQAKNLSTKEQFNVPAMYLESAQNVSHSPIGLQVHALNGKDLKHNIHKGADEWSTLYLHPGQAHNFKHLNDGKGLLIASNPLDDYGNINVQMAPGDLLKAAKTHDDYIGADGKPTKYIVGVDLSGFGNPTAPVEEKLKPLSPLARVVFANAKLAFSQVPGIEQAIGGPLPPLNHDDVHGEKMFPTIEIRPDLLGAKQGRFNAFVDADQLKEAIEHYAREVTEKAQPTSADQHKIRVIRVGRMAGEKIGDIKNELGVGPAEIDRAKNQWAGVHVKFNYDVQHNGKPFDGAK